MGENELGLKKAIQSGEDDLVYLSVMHIEQEAGSSEKGREAFFELMLAHPEALRLLKVGYCRTTVYPSNNGLTLANLRAPCILTSGWDIVVQQHTHQIVA